MSTASAAPLSEPARDPIDAAGSSLLSSDAATPAVALAGPLILSDALDNGPLLYETADLGWVDRILSEAPAQDQSPFETLDQCVQVEMERTGTPGASLAIAVNGVITYTKGYGVKDLEAGTAVDEQTLFRIGSTTKMMTAAAVMQLVEQGAMDLHSPITTYVPDLQLAPPWDADTITLHHLLTHTGGLPDAYYISDAATPLDEWVPILSAIPLWAPPGSFFNYSNPNFSLAGVAVQNVSGEDMYDYLPSHLWGPAGMPTTTMDPEEVVAFGNYATGHSGDQRLAPNDFDIPVVGPAGLAFSTPTEMVTWALLLSRGGDAILSSESVAAMQSRQVTLDYAPWMDYGYGVFVTDYLDAGDPGQTVAVLDHGGNVPGGSSQLYWIPEQGFAVSVLANTGASLSGSAHCALAIFAGLDRIPFDDATTTPSEWAPFEGTYSMLDIPLHPFTAQVRLEEDVLGMRFPDLPLYPDIYLNRLIGPDFQLVPLLASAFAIDDSGDGVPDVPIDFTFIPDRQQPARTTHLRQRLMVGERVGMFPERVALQGSRCTDLGFTVDIDAADMTATAAGLDPSIYLADVPIEQDEPANPASASFKYDIALDSDALLLSATVSGQPGSALGLYLMMDANGDEEFVFPDEAINLGLGSANAKALHMGSGLPAGSYQLWVHGVSVEGAAETFDLDVTIAAGDALSVGEIQGTGAARSVRVCAQPPMGLRSPRVGTVQFDYGSPPRSVRVLVDWEPVPPLLLPFALNQE